MVCVLITSFLVLAVLERMRSAPVLEGACPAVYNNCQRFVTMLVDKISRHDKTNLQKASPYL